MAKKKTVAGTAADPTINFTEVEIDGNTYHLAFDFNSIATAEAATGLNLLQTFAIGRLSASELRAVFYACAMKAHPELTLEDVGSLMRPTNLAKIIKFTVAAWTGSMPQEQDPDPNAEAPATESD